MLDLKTAALPRQGSSGAARLMAASVLVLASVAAVFSAQAQGHHGPGMGGRDGGHGTWQ